MSFRVKRKPALRRLKQSWATIQDVEQRFDGRARIVVRYSGTEPKVRVMVEAR